MSHSHVRRRRVAIAALTASLLLPALAPAATYGLKSHGRAVSAINPSSAYHDLRDDTGWLLTGPAVVDLNADSGTNGAGGAHVDAVLHADSDFGALHLSGHGDSTNSNQTGDFSWDSSYIGGEPNAWYTDQLEIISPSLPNGTPVTLRFTLTFAGTVSASTPPPGFNTYATLHGQLVANSSLGSPNPSAQLDVGASTTSAMPAQATGTVQTYVGASVSLSDKFWIDAAADTNAYGSPLFTQSYAFDGTTTTQIEVLTPGASYVADSLATYVPEPASLLAVCGLALPALFTRRRFS